MQKKQINGGLIDAISSINKELKEKYHRSEKVFGFEKSQKGKHNLRFFDKEEKTIWLPQDLYDKYNRYLVENGALEKGKIVAFPTNGCITDLYNRLFCKNR